MMNTTELHPQRCDTCSNNKCDFYKQRDRDIAIQDSQELKATPAWITKKVGCANYISQFEFECNELKKEIKKLQDSKEFYEKRCNELQKYQSHMRDPERDIVCSILANGFLISTPVIKTMHDNNHYCDDCHFKRKCSLIYIPPCAKRMSQRINTSREDALSKLQMWRYKSMTGVLKQDVWKLWNDETEYIDSLKTSE